MRTKEDILGALCDNEMYRKAIESSTDKDKAAISKFVEVPFVTLIQAMESFIESLEKDPELYAQVAMELNGSERVVNNGPSLSGSLGR